MNDEKLRRILEDKKLRMMLEEASPQQEIERLRDEIARLVASAPELLGSLTELLKAIGASDIELHRHGIVAAVQRAVLAINVATNAR